MSGAEENGNGSSRGPVWRRLPLTLEAGKGMVAGAFVIALAMFHLARTLQSDGEEMKAAFTAALEGEKDERDKMEERIMARMIHEVGLLRADMRDLRGEVRDLRALLIAQENK